VGAGGTGIGDAAPIWRAALLARCPRCGQGPLFAGVLTVREQCAVCGLDLRACDTGDGPAVFAILIVGAVVVTLAFWVEFHFSPALWVHALIWPVLTIALAIAVMRPVKAALVALQYRHRATEMRM